MISSKPHEGVRVGFGSSQSVYPADTFYLYFLLRAFMEHAYQPTYQLDDHADNRDFFLTYCAGQEL